MVCSWKKNRHTIEEAAVKSRHESFTKLNEEVCEARLRSKRVSHAWLRSQARNINRSQLNDPNATVGRSVVAHFAERYRIKIRRSNTWKQWTRRFFGKNSWSCIVRRKKIWHGPVAISTTPFGAHSPPKKVLRGQGALVLRHWLFPNLWSAFN